MTIQEFFSKWSGRKLDYDGNSGAQCVDLAKAFAHDVLGTPTVTGNAVDWWSRYDSSKYDRIANTLTFVPRQGDIMVWGTKVGSAGHIAVINSANVFNFNSFDQNWPIGTGCHFVTHSYSGVLGVLRPKAKAATTFTVEIKTTYLNMRPTPSTDKPAIGGFKLGEKATVYSVQYSGGRNWYNVGAGWIASDFTIRT